MEFVFKEIVQNLLGTHFIKVFFVKPHRTQFSKTMPNLKLIKATGKMLFHMYVCLYSPVHTNPVHRHIKDGVSTIYI